MPFGDGSSTKLPATKRGKAIRFNEEQVRCIGRVGRGVKGIELEGEDEVIGMLVLEEGSSILTVTENGYGKRTSPSEYRPQSRAGKGIINIKTTDRNGHVISVVQVFEDDSIMMITREGTLIWLKVKGISVIGRNTSGVKLQNLGENQKVVDIAKLAEQEE